MAKGSRPRRQRTKSGVPGEVADTTDVSADDTQQALTPDEERKLFLNHLSAWNEYQAKLKVVEALGKTVKDALKGDGFTIKMMKIADQLTDVKGETKVKSEIEERLKVARWMGHPLGAQLDLFDQPDRTPAVERAYDEGKMASMQDHPARPSYAPETPQYAQYMAGYHDHQRELAGGLRAPRSGDESTMAHH